MTATQLTALHIDRVHRLGLPAMLPDGQGLYFRKQTASGATAAFDKHRVSSHAGIRMCRSPDEMKLARMVHGDAGWITRRRLGGSA